MKFSSLVLALLSAIAAAPAWAEPLPVRIAFSQVGVDGRQFAGLQTTAIAHARGYLEQEFKNDPDIKLEFIFFKGAGPATNEAAANGQIDFYSQGDLPSIVGRAAGIKSKLLLNVAARQPRYVAVRPESDLRTIGELRGRKVAQHRGTNLTLSVPKILAANGLTERDIKFINMDNATAVAALATGNIDAAFGTQQLLELERKGIARIIYSTKNDSPTFTSNSAFFVTENFESRHPEVTYRVVRAIVKAAAWASDERNREAVFETWALSGVPAANYRADFEGQTVKNRNSPLIDDFLVNFYKDQAVAAKNFGYIRRDVDLNGWFEPKYLDRAIKEQKFAGIWDAYDARGAVKAD